LEALSAMKPADVRGRIVFINERMRRERDGSGYGPAVAKRSRGAVEAARLGAVGVVIRTVGTSNNRIAPPVSSAYQGDVRRIPAIATSNPDADLLERHVAPGRDVSFRIRSTARSLPNERSANGIGEIPGRGKKDEIVLLAAHLDSWDLATGAHDDAAGVGIVTAAARLIGDLRRAPERTIRVVLYANEEFGLSGARQYVKEHRSEEHTSEL